MNKLLGFSRPNDFPIFSLRAKLSKKYGMFGKIPMWGGVRLHEFYPPLSTLFVRVFGLIGTLLVYLVLMSTVLYLNRDLIVSVLFLTSYFHLYSMFLAGRLSEHLGYCFVALAFFSANSVISGICLGLAGLCYPVPLMVGTLLLVFKLDGIALLIAFIVCGWWYIPFFLKKNRITFLSEKRADKFLGLYLMQWSSMFNLVIFLCAPEWTIITIWFLFWFLPIQFKYGVIPIGPVSLKYIFYRPARLLFKFIGPFFAKDLIEKFPRIKDIKESPIIIKQPNLAPNILNTTDEISGSLAVWIWACACYLIDRGVIVYNGIPSTEVPKERLKVPQDIKTYSILDLGNVTFSELQV